MRYLLCCGRLSLLINQARQQYAQFEQQDEGHCHDGLVDQEDTKTCNDFPVMPRKVSGSDPGGFFNRLFASPGPGFDLFLVFVGLAGFENFHGFSECRTDLRQLVYHENHQNDHQNESNIQRTQFKRHD